MTTTVRTVPSDPRQAVAFFSGTAADRPLAAEHDSPLIYHATDNASISFGATGTMVTLVEGTNAPPPFVTATWHLEPQTVTSTALVDGTVYAQLYRVPPGATTITGLAVQVGTQASTTVMRLGAYAVAADFTVGAKLLDASTVSATTTGTKTITSLTLPVPTSRWIYLIAAAQGGTPSVYTAANRYRVPQSTATNSLTGLSVPTATSISGALGGTFTNAAYVAVGPAIAVQLAA